MLGSQSLTNYLSLRASACGCVAISSHTGQYFSLNKEIATQIASNLLAMTGSVRAFFSKLLAMTKRQYITEDSIINLFNSK